MSKGKILVVDDDALVLAGLLRVFENGGYDIKTALGGKAALEIVRRECFDLVYTDMVMPDINGAELCEKIKAISPNTEVILFSGTPAGLLQLWQRFISAGGKDEILRKPLSKDEMLLATEQVMERRRQKPAE